MNKATKIIIALCVALLLVASVLVVSLVQGGTFKKEETTKPAYSLQATTKPSTTAVTESWVDLDQMASELATATDTTDPSDTTETTIETTIPAEPVILTTIVYVYTEYVTTEPTTEKLTSSFDDGMQEYKYVINKESNSVTITKYLGDNSTVWVPEEIGGYTVSAIGDKCFQKQSLKVVCIPETVRSIGNNAFQDCKNLTSVNFLGASPGVTVGNNAFQNCSKLENINLPEAKTIGNFAFDGCTSLEKIELKPGTESIGEYCFRNCSSLTLIKIPDSVTYIGNGVFGGERKGELTIECVKGSKGDEAAQKYSIKVEYVN
ncbi:MAG: leucine-rich repeat domain-containing protein [Clostridia bacterium]|nr:leucine-rich repeat domain-containing protein [Clostridia bacterium]